MLVGAVGLALADLLVRVAHQIQPIFPHHSEAIFGEIVDTVLTNERWNRVGKIISSIHSVPGVALVGLEHDCRNMLISCEALVTSMVTATTGIGRTDEALRFVEWRTREVSGELQKMKEEQA